MRILLLSLLLLFSQSPTIADYPQVFLYPYPSYPEYQTLDQDLLCDELDRQLMNLEPLTYSYRPGFHYDLAQATAIRDGFLRSPAWCHLPYPGVVAYQDDLRRILDSRRRVDMIRRLKASRRCYPH